MKTMLPSLAMALAGILLSGSGFAAAAQTYDDDIYYDASKAPQTKRPKKFKAKNYVPTPDYAPADSYGPAGPQAVSEAAIDLYNRRGIFADADTTGARVVNADTLGQFLYTQRIEKFHNPNVVVDSDDPDLQYYYNYANSGPSAYDRLEAYNPRVDVYVNGYYDPYYNFDLYGSPYPYWGRRRPYWNWSLAFYDPFYIGTWGWNCGWYNPYYHWGYNPWYPGYRPWEPGYPWYPGHQHWYPGGGHGGHGGNTAWRPSGSGSSRPHAVVGGAGPGSGTYRPGQGSAGYRPGSNTGSSYRPGNMGQGRPGYNPSSRPGGNRYNPSSNSNKGGSSSTIEYRGRGRYGNSDNSSNSWGASSNSSRNSSSSSNSYNSPSSSSHGSYNNGSSSYGRGNYGGGSTGSSSSSNRGRR